MRVQLTGTVFKLSTEGLFESMQVSVKSVLLYHLLLQLSNIAAAPEISVTYTCPTHLSHLLIQTLEDLL